MAEKPAHRRARILHDFAGSWQTIRQSCDRNDDGVNVINYKKLFENVGKKRGRPVTEQEIENLKRRMDPPPPPKKQSFIKRTFGIKPKLPKN